MNFVEEIDNDGNLKCHPDESCDIEGCNECSDNNEKICETCDEGYYKFSGTCIPCFYPCNECAYNRDTVYDDIIVPYIEELRGNFSENNSSNDGN